MEIANTAASQYEGLRRAVLGKPVAPHERNGLVIFLRRGMWSWTRSLSVPVPVRQPRASAGVGVTPTDQRAVIQLFAAMALHVNPERDP